MVHMNDYMEMDKAPYDKRDLGFTKQKCLKGWERGNRGGMQN